MTMMLDLHVAQRPALSMQTTEKPLDMGGGYVLSYGQGGMVFPESAGVNYPRRSKIDSVPC
jgi:hypothetical protein